MKKILIIDDDSTLRAMLAEYLAQLGFDIAQAEDGNSGIRLIREQEFDLVVTDNQMPDGSGFEVLRFIKENRPAMPRLMLSSMLQEDQLRELVLLEAQYIEKPPRLSVIFAVLKLYFPNLEKPTRRTSNPTP